MPLSEIEQEAIVLKTALDVIGDMVSFTMFKPLANTTEVTLDFGPNGSSRLFNILLGDFLGISKPIPFDLPKPNQEKPPQEQTPCDQTYIFFLRRIVSKPLLGNDPKLIGEPLEAFATWLETVTTVPKVWFPSVGVECDLTLKRIDFLKLCGDLAKHSLARLSVNEGRLQEIFRDHDHPLKPGQAYLVMSEFYDWFHTNLFVYHSSTMAEFLNNIRWGIYAYLSDSAQEAYVPIPHETLPLYTIKPADGVSDPLAFSMFYDLMDTVRRSPTFPRFTVSEWLKKRY